jgi:NAD(P)-dependent dehydrogenase (short-subunit alcohol dehydrogenase family)
LTDLSTKHLSSTIDKLRSVDSNIQVLPLQANVASEKEVDNAIQQTIDKFGRIDVAVNVAGIGGAAFRTSECEESEWRKVMDINIDGVWRCQRAELRAMLKQEYVCFDSG